MANNTTAPLRVLQIGCGPRSGVHLEAMQRSGAVEIVAVCDHNASKARDMAARFGVARHYTDLAEALATEKPELANITTRATLRGDIVEAAVRAGAAAISIEKPMALSPSETRRLEQLGDGRLIAVNTQYQWMPHWQRFWKVLENGELGEIRLLRASTRYNLLEQGPHILDLALRAASLSNLPSPEWVLAACTAVQQFGDMRVPAETTAIAGLGEARLHLDAGSCAPQVPGETTGAYHIQVEVLGSRGRLWVSLNQGWTLWRDGHFESGETAWPRNDGEAQAAYFVHLRNSLHQGEWQSFPTRVQMAAHISDLMFACYASALEHRRVEINEPLDDSLLERLEALSG